VGDVHGCRDVLLELLRGAELVDDVGRWSGLDARVWLLGDLVDRGPDGIGAIELVRRLERESDGAVRCLLGNHEALILSTFRFGDEETSFPGSTFHELWKLNGGVDADLRGLTPDVAAWIASLPALAREGDWLLLHADTTAYLELGDDLESVVHAVRDILEDGDLDAHDDLLSVVSDRMRLTDPAAVDALLGAFGGTRIVHGHTPIASVRGLDPRDVTGPLVYGEGRVWNIDHCLFAGGPGFVTRLDGGSGPEA
jgi:hypothetical protein